MVVGYSYHSDIDCGHLGCDYDCCVCYGGGGCGCSYPSDVVLVIVTGGDYGCYGGEYRWWL